MIIAVVTDVFPAHPATFEEAENQIRPSLSQSKADKLVAQRADDLWVKVFVPSTDLGRLKLGQAVEVTVDSHPGKRFPGEVVHIATVSEFTPRNVQ